MKYYNDGKIVVKSWCNNPEPKAIEQATNLANLPFAFRHIALMPDTHEGYGMPIGGVLATKNVIVPNAVGVDIGCGMCALQTKIKKEDVDEKDLKAILGRIRSTVPVGFNHQSKKQDVKYMPSVDMPEFKDLDTFIIGREYEKARSQIGTLGGGNHFLEIQVDSEGFIWIMIHSGSRNLGKQVADYYNEEAKKLNERYYSSVDPKLDLAFLSLEDSIGWKYVQEMQYCVDFALANRKLMMERVKEAFFDVLHEFPTDNYDINIAHNYVKIEHHFNTNVWVHRKGATAAWENTIGIIPGSQGSSSYIVKGKGNSESFKSCSHGAGRKMGRKAAQKNLNLEEEKKKLDDKGILHSIRGVDDLDEASGAYKDIDVVMEEQNDLVDILYKLEPIAVIKG